MDERITADEACPLACTDQLSCAAPSTENYVWLEESAGSPVRGSVINARRVFSAGDSIPHDTYAVAFCDDGGAMDYSCVIKCRMGEIDYSMCGPGGTEGKGEQFKIGVCVPPLEARINTNCNIPWDVGFV